MKSKSIEILLKDLLGITIKETYRLSEILAKNFDSFDKQIIEILKQEYQKPKSNWRVICGCFSVMHKAYRSNPRIGSKTFQSSYHLLNKGLQDKRISIKRLATLVVLNLIYHIYFERGFAKLSTAKDNNEEIEAEIKLLKENIKSEVFIESFNSANPSNFDKRISCESAGIREEVLVEVAKSILG